jgi:hypothetical protein
MALVHSSTIVQTTPTKILQMPSGVQYTTVTIFNSNAAAIFIGDSTLTTSGNKKGVTVASASSIVICLNAGDALYAIAAAATAAGDVVVLFSGI